MHENDATLTSGLQDMGKGPTIGCSVPRCETLNSVHDGNIMETQDIVIHNDSRCIV